MNDPNMLGTEEALRRDMLDAVAELRALAESCFVDGVRSAMIAPEAVLEVLNRAAPTQTETPAAESTAAR